MSNNQRVLNITRGYSLKHKQALRAVENCACTWVEFGVSIRDLTLAEAIAARNKQASEREPLADAELPGIIYKPAKQTPAAMHEMQIAWQANKFAYESTA